MRRGTWGVILALFLPAAAVAQTRVGVIVVGPDTTSVAAAQKTLEAKLAGPSVTVRGATDLAAVIGGPVAATASAWANDPAARSAFDAAMAEARKSYFSDLMPEANAKLDAAQAIVDSAVDVPGATRVRVALWRAAVALRKNQKDAATAEINVALLLVPNLEPEPNSPPPMLQLLSEIRAKSPKPFRVTLAGLPANAVVKIDDVVFPAGSIAVLPGPHVIDVLAPGFRPFNASFDAAGDTTLDVVLVQAIGPAWETLFDAIVTRGEVAENEKKSLESLAAREKLDFLVIASAGPGEVKAAVWRRSDGRITNHASAAAAETAAWSAQQLTRAVAAATPTATPLAMATPVGTAAVVPTPSTPRPGPGRGVQLAAEAGIGYANWTRTIASEVGGDGYEVKGLGGAGPRIRLLGRVRGFEGHLDVRHLRFGTMKTQTPPPDLEPVDVPGGAMTTFQLAVGYRYTFRYGPVGREPTVFGTFGFFSESYAAEDLADTGGVFPSHTHSGPALRIGGTVFLGPVELFGEIGGWGRTKWKEEPVGATGDDPKSSTSFFRVGASVAVARNAHLGVEFDLQTRSVTYTGQGDNELRPVDASRDEDLGVFAATFGYRF